MATRTALIAAAILIIAMFFIRYTAATNSRINSLRKLMEITLEEKKETEEDILRLSNEENEDSKEKLKEAKEELGLIITDHNRYVDKYNEIVKGSYTGLIAKIKKAEPADNIS